jgi:hypothetical protein
MELNPIPTDLFLLLFQNGKRAAVLETVSKLLLTIKDSLSNDNEEEKSQKPLCFHFKVINKLINYYRNTNTLIRLTRFMLSINKIDLAEVSFEGEPLNGLQIMGVLESRVLDFDTVIVTSMNEGKFLPENLRIRLFV